ncbi:MAG: AAA family ATPase [Xanthomonadales bacterium]|nr:AAA family ATPase [Xanthomonadales bacterium]
MDDLQRMREADDASAAEEEAQIRQAQREHERRFRLVTAGELKIKPAAWLVRDYLEKNSLAAYFGPPEAWKSLYLQDMACCVAHGVEFHGHEVEQGNVVYLCGEGFGGLAKRFRAWCIRHDQDPEQNPVLISTQPAALTDPVNLASVSGVIAKAEPDLIVIDTLARNFGGADENSTSDMGSFIQACDALRIENDCAVALVHHSGHMDKNRGRGNSALKGALDWEYRFSRIDDVVEVECTKSKDHDRPTEQAFRLEVVEVDTDDAGLPVTSVTLASTDRPKPPPSSPSGKWQLKALAVLGQMTDEHRDNLKDSGHSPEQARVKLADWRERCIDREKIPRNRWYEAKRTLAESKQICVEGYFVELAG